jgi:methylthioribose-1-phosphate isomerase
MRLSMKRIGLIAALGVTLACVAQADQSKMKDALQELRQAKQALEQAKDNKGGHKSKALDHIDKAISQVQQGMAAAEGDD